ncbi:hypothetical protein [Streptomyces iakyrus]|uniref:hypothetical protein n=1 Tax=Streptomyces iakyrus TaxID=68219 RepID=UPI003D92221F
MSAVLAAGAAPFGTASFAQAYSPSPSASTYKGDAGSCPCSGKSLSDPFDGTFLAHDSGGLAVKTELIAPCCFVGEVNFLGTSEVVDVTVEDFDIPDCVAVDISDYDRPGRSDLVAAARDSDGMVG